VKLDKRIFSFGLAAIALSAAFGVQAQTALADVMKAKSIRIAIPTDYPPYGFVGVDLVPQGLDIDMAKLIGDKLGVKVELLPVSSANRIPYLQTKKADLVISTLGKNPEREKVLDFTSAYAPFFQAVYASKNLNIKSFGDLAGKTVAVTRGAMEDEELAKVAPATVDYKRFEDNNATMSAFVAGQTQVVAMSASGAGIMMMKNPQLGTEYKLLIKESPCFVGVAKGEDALRLKINEIIANATKDGTIDALSKKWLGRPAGKLPV
jgi:polar amino acid transport system substrate-binding protein